MALNELAARYAKEGKIPEEIVYVPVVCSTTCKTFYYKFCLYPHLKPEWMMMEVCLEAPKNTVSSSQTTVNLNGYRYAEELTCPFCGTVGFGQHTNCGTVFCREFGTSDKLYCPKCRKTLEPDGKTDELKGELIQNK